MIPMTPEDRAALLAQLGDADPATDALLGAVGDSIAGMRQHAHPRRDDSYCENLAQWVGEHEGPVLRRLLDAEAEADRLRAERDEMVRIAVGDGMRLQDGPVDEIRSLRAKFDAQRSRANTLDKLCRDLQARVAELEQQSEIRRVQREPGLCPPCRRGECDECMAVDHPDLRGLYACHYVDQPHAACPRRGGAL